MAGERSADDLARTFVAAETRIEELVAAAAASIAARTGRRAVEQRLRVLVATVDRLAGGLDEAASVWLSTRLGQVFADAARSANPQFVWTAANVATLTALAATASTELRAATTFLRRDARLFRRQALHVATALAAADVDDSRVAQRLTRPLIDRNIRAVRYANGARHPIGTYAQMVLRTTTVRTRNTAVLDELEAAGVEWVEVRDGADCGWRFHDDPDTADRTVRPLADARRHLLAHPNCRRTFTGRPDVADDAQAAAEAAATLRVRRAAARVESARSTAAARAAATRRRSEARRQAHLRSRRRRTRA